MNKFCTTLMFVFFCFASFAQQTIDGIVVDEQSKEPLVRAAVLVKGTSIGVTTDFDGKFTLEVDPGQVLVVSYLGYVTKEVPVTATTKTVTVRLMKDAMNLDEVVVVGYGVTRKRDVAGAITSLKTDDIKAGMVTSTAQFLKGRAAGVQVRQNSGEPGGGISIRVRGSSSISSNNEPLYVIDGFQTDIDRKSVV